MWNDAADEKQKLTVQTEATMKETGETGSYVL